MLNGDHNMFEFDVNTNIGNEVGLAIMFEVYVEYIMKDSEILTEQGLSGLPVRGKVVSKGKGEGTERE